jgi:hypothetical protein
MTETEQRLAALEAEFAQLRRTIVLREVFLEEVENRAYQRGRESVLGTRSAAQQPRPRHLQLVGGGAQ